MNTAMPSAGGHFLVAVVCAPHGVLCFDVRVIINLAEVACVCV